MADIRSNADEIASRYRARQAALAPAVKAALRRAGLAVERAQVKRLTGSGAAWTYPVPVRTGNLRRSTFVQQQGPLMVFVGNTADYANAIHTGGVSEWAGRGKHRFKQRKERPFLDDAVKDADPVGIVHDDVVAAITAMAI